MHQNRLQEQEVRLFDRSGFVTERLEASYRASASYAPLRANGSEVSFA